MMNVVRPAGGETVSRVSVIIPACNSEEFIERTLLSVLGQTLSEIEIFVVCNGSEDSTCTKVKSIFSNHSRDGIRKILLSQQNSGVSVSRNKGLISTTGEYAMLFNSDGLMDSECLSKLHGKAIVTKSDVVFCGIDRTDFSGDMIKVYQDHFSYLETPKSRLEEALAILHSPTWI